MTFINRFVAAVCSIGARGQIQHAAKTQVVVPEDEKHSVVSIDEDAEAYKSAPHQKLLDRWLDKTVEFSGSTFMFFAILLGLLTWALLGIPFGSEENWQVGISDTQAILNLIFDSLLMRQQLNTHTQSLIVSCNMRSRTISQKRMLRSIIAARARNEPINVRANQIRTIGVNSFETKLPSENWLGKICTAVSTFSGHIVTVAGFWACIVVWLGFGNYCGWSSDWLFYINSATSALMIFLLAFLANIRERHDKYASICLDLIYKADAALELKLRAATGDELPNEVVTIEAPNVGRIQRWINFYADLVGTLLGIILLGVVLVIWVAIGPTMSFSSDWWLLIGTYAGLIGMNDGFVLRNVLDDMAVYENQQFEQQLLDDEEMMNLAQLSTAGVTLGAIESGIVVSPVSPSSLSYRVSLRMGWFCSHRYMVIAGFIAIIGLIIGASALNWSIIGQLLANVPPSIVESFFTLILITGHNIGDGRRRAELRAIYEKRLALLAWVDGGDVGHMHGSETVEDKGKIVVPEIGR